MRRASAAGRCARLATSVIGFLVPKGRTPTPCAGLGDRLDVRGHAGPAPTRRGFAPRRDLVPVDPPDARLYPPRVDPFEAYERRGLTWERAMAHARHLAGLAREQHALDPSVRLVALVLAPDASEIAAQLPELIAKGIAKPDDWVPLLVRREQALQMLRANVPQGVEWLAEDDGPERRLPVIVVTSFGVRLGYETYRVGGGAETERSRRPRRVPCTVHAMLVCREAFQQAGTGKWCIIGTHGRVLVARLPCAHRFTVFLCIGDFVSGSKLELRVRAEDEVLCRAELEVGTWAQIGQVEVGLPLPLELSRAGVHQVELCDGGTVLARREIVVEEQQP